jgi:hypothetical protein
MKELTKISKANGNIVPVSEAFKNFPVEEEVHKGDISFWEQQEVKVEL